MTVRSGMQSPTAIRAATATASVGTPPAPWYAMVDEMYLSPSTHRPAARAGRMTSSANCARLAM